MNHKKCKYCGQDVSFLALKTLNCLLMIQITKFIMIIELFRPAQVKFAVNVRSMRRRKTIEF